MTNTKTKYGIFYKSQGKWIPLRTDVTKQPRTFTSKRELARFQNSYDFTCYKNYYLKSATSVRKIS